MERELLELNYLSAEEQLRIYKKDSETAARELYYPDSVIRRINKAGSIYEINRILFDARNKKIEDAEEKRILELNRKERR